MYKKCPLCKRKLYQNGWFDERGVVEYINECHNKDCTGYKHHWYYGTTELKVGEFEVSFLDHGYLKAEDKLIAKNNWKEFKQQVKKHKVQMLIK